MATAAQKCTGYSGIGRLFAMVMYGEDKWTDYSGAEKVNGLLKEGQIG